MSKHTSSKEIPFIEHLCYHDFYFKKQAHEDWILSRRSLPPEQFEIHALEVWKNTINPHRLNAYMIILVTSGSVRLSLGMKDYRIKDNTLCFIGPNLIHSWDFDGNRAKGFVCVFSSDFFNLGFSTVHF